ncbi:MAG: hypothetical protein KGJ02_03835 [Verrucomicrobiota bacterium]|nr:hypothetical protein [Verrucomicrobiota bacterium]
MTSEFIYIESSSGTLLVSSEEGRKLLHYPRNETASFVPKKYFSSVAAQDPEWEKRSVQHLFTPPVISDELAEIAELTDDIRSHFETRLQLFYQQLLLFAGSKFKLDKHSTKAQAGLKNKNPKEEAKGTTAEAHSSTLPSIKGWPQKENLSFLKGATSSVNAIEIGNESFFHHTWNGTSTLPVGVNKVDSRLDNQTPFDFFGEQTFRQLSIDILNGVSSGELSLKDGFTGFSTHIESALNHLLDTYAEGTAEKEVVRIYQRTAAHWKRFLKVEDSWEKLSFSKEEKKKLQKKIWGRLQKKIWSRLQKKIWSQLQKKIWSQLQKKIWSQLQKKIWSQLQKKMWSHMESEVEAYSILKKIHGRAMEILKKKTVQQGEFLLPGILLEYASPFPNLQNYCLENAKEASDTQRDYARRAAADDQIRTLAKTYFQQFQGINQTKDDLQKPNGAWQKKFFSTFKPRLHQILGKNPQKAETIFWLVVPRLYDHFFSSSKEADPRAIAIRKFLCFNDAMLEQELRPYPKTWEHISTCVNDIQIRELTNRLLGRLDA